ncbi:MAG: aminopeptidase P family protein [Pelagibacterales bacterium]|nr:aminopeptidase P family protein [Pelagibacterales bacterium]
MKNQQSLVALKKFLKSKNLDFFLLPNSDQFFSEYLPQNQKRVQYLTNFSGSNAWVVFGQEKSYFFTDGRYILQAQNELDLEEFEIFNIGDKTLIRWMQENIGTRKIAIDPQILSVNFVKTCLNFLQNIVFLEENPIDEIWHKKPNSSNSEVFFCDEKVVGLNSWQKRQEILPQVAADALIITKPENLCWLLNLRASDVEFTPFLLAYAILFKSGEAELFINKSRLKDLKNFNLEKVKIIETHAFEKRVRELTKELKTVQIDEATTNYWLYNLLQKSGCEIINKSDVIELQKSIKNSAEIYGAIQSHKADGLAVTKFLFWLQKSLKEGQEIDELKAENKLLEFRQESPEFLYPSFRSISSFGANGAIIHYHSSEKTNKKIAGNSLYLIDSGGQYFSDNFLGTTDVTRTIAVGKPSSEMVKNFTRVLKGHIALACAKFPNGSCGADLDVLARFHLWQAGLNYDHGTGHGVGAFLSVHEGPCAISKRSRQELLPGMILSNEPGFYKAGEYGIRIENLMLVEKFDDKFLCFKTLTLVPIDPNLIDFKMLTYYEKKWLKNYHEQIRHYFFDKLDQEILVWLNLIY